MTAETIRLLRERTAQLAIGASTLRKQGARGVVSAARKWLKRVKLDSFRVRSQQRFDARLNAATKSLMKNLPQGARHWGTARKALNIFLRDVLYCCHLRSWYRLTRLERWLEVPLDRYVATGLREEKEGADLPRWPGVKDLTPAISARFQAVALQVARRKRTKRVHLDLHYFRRPLTARRKRRCARRAGP